MQLMSLRWGSDFPAGMAAAGTCAPDARLDTPVKRTIGTLALAREDHSGPMIELAGADDGAGSPSATARALELRALERCAD